MLRMRMGMSCICTLTWLLCKACHPSLLAVQADGLSHLLLLASICLQADATFCCCCCVACSSSRCVVDGRQLMEDGMAYCSIRYGNRADGNRVQLYIPKVLPAGTTP